MFIEQRIEQLERGRDHAHQLLHHIAEQNDAILAALRDGAIHSAVIAAIVKLNAKSAALVAAVKANQ